MRSSELIDPLKSWRKGIHTVNATNTLAKGGHQKEDKRYGAQASPPPNNPPQHVYQDPSHGYGQSASYYGEHPLGVPSSPFTTNMPYPPSQSPPTVNYTTGQSPAFLTQQAPNYNTQTCQEPEQMSPSTGGYPPYSDQNQQNGTRGIEDPYNRNPGVVYSHAHSKYQPDSATYVPTLHRNNTDRYDSNYNQYGYQARPEAAPRSLTMPTMDHACVYERNQYTGTCNKCGAYVVD